MTTTKQAEQALKMHLEGKSYDEIGDFLVVNHTMVAFLIKIAKENKSRHLVDILRGLLKDLKSTIMEDIPAAIPYMEALVEYDDARGLFLEETIGQLRMVENCLSKRTLHLLYDNDIQTIKKLTQKTEADLLAIPLFNKECLSNVKDTLTYFGLELKRS